MPEEQEERLSNLQWATRVQQNNNQARHQGGEERIVMIPRPVKTHEADRPEIRFAGADQHVCRATIVTGAGDLHSRQLDCILRTDVTRESTNVEARH